ncbi:nuclear factor of activated T-cells, cytoplasmic 3 isoform X2 [Microcaecilia unicolor]|uniref:Nuclear factor of activated T-cells, cytoplasmic 3 isoform X2 n=1 Tax=Microcaecilia unicolor TaxID=1415580 RepID=A0A6P7Y5E8_9AMPH|nr:nuclear factor of activated T-cells, cytoplasmic 3 isoform X2 [Microcaecilia unicolor]
MAASAESRFEDLEPDDCASFYIFNVDQPQSATDQPICIPHHGLQSHCSAFSPHRLQSYKNYVTTSGIQDSKCSLSGPKPFECPSIQITSISPHCQQGIEINEDDLHANGPENEYTDKPSRDHLYLPLELSYRESSLSPSPGSSISSRSWFSDAASSCESISHVYDDVDSELNEAAARFTLGSPSASPSGSPRGCQGDESWQQPYGFGPSLSPRQSPCHSPRTSITDENWLSPRPTSRPSSRPTSPCGKRRHSSADICYAGSLSPHHSPTPSPGHSPRGSVTEDTWLSTSLHTGQGLSPGLSQFQCCAEIDVPLKTRKTSDDPTATLSGNIDLGSEDKGSLSPSLETPTDESSGSQHLLKKDLSGEQFLSVPSHFTWSKPKPGHTPIFRTSSLPPLDWPLPSHYGQYELKVEIHPKTHHRAHYETEGSRGAVKASTGGHPVVKLLGYSDKPVNLQMFIGTADDRYLRPHAFYQVHRITGKTVATASQEIIITSTKVLEIPLLPENNMSASIDCAGILKLRNSDIELRKAQRSAQELPQIEKYNINSCSVNGGVEMVVTGSNFLPDSKIIFFEKGQDGRPQWEAEGKIIREKCQGPNIVVEVPHYHNNTVTTAVQVQFYLCNGKRKRSQSQRFTYTPVLLKQEHQDEIDLPVVSAMSVPCNESVQGLHTIQTQRSSPDTGHTHDNLLSTSQRSLPCAVQQPYTSVVSPAISHLSHMQGRNISLGAECHMMPPILVHQAFQVASAPSVRQPYQAMQSVIYKEQPGLPVNSASNQGFDTVPFQQDATVPHLINLGCQPLPQLQYHSPTTGSSTSTSAAGHSLIHPRHSEQSSPHLQSMGYHCPNTGQGSTPSPTTNQPVGQTSPQLQSVPYHSSNPTSASSPSPTTSYPLAHSPLSEPSSPQLQPIPYQSSSSCSVTSPSPATITHSGQPSPQANSPGLGNLSAAPSLLHHNVCDSSPFSSDGVTLNIKPEPEEQELNFQTIVLQDITLDDVNEIIGRDMSHGAVLSSQSPHGCPGSQETGMSDKV